MLNDLINLNFINFIIHIIQTIIIFIILEFCLIPFFPLFNQIFNSKISFKNLPFKSKIIFIFMLYFTCFIHIFSFFIRIFAFSHYFILFLNKKQIDFIRFKNEKNWFIIHIINDVYYTIWNIIYLSIKTNKQNNFLKKIINFLLILILIIIIGLSPKPIIKAINLSETIISRFETYNINKIGWIKLVCFFNNLKNFIKIDIWLEYENIKPESTKILLVNGKFICNGKEKIIKNTIKTWTQSTTIYPSSKTNGVEHFGWHCINRPIYTHLINKHKITEMEKLFLTNMKKRNFENELYNHYNKISLQMLNFKRSYIELNEEIEFKQSLIFSSNPHRYLPINNINNIIHTTPPKGIVSSYDSTTKKTLSEGSIKTLDKIVRQLKTNSYELSQNTICMFEIRDLCDKHTPILIQNKDVFYNIDKNIKSYTDLFFLNEQIKKLSFNINEQQNIQNFEKFKQYIKHKNEFREIFINELHNKLKIEKKLIFNINLNNTSIWERDIINQIYSESTIIFKNNHLNGIHFIPDYNLLE